MGEGQDEALGVGVHLAERELVVVEPAMDGVVAHVLQGVVHPPHVPLEAEAEPQGKRRPVTPPRAALRTKAIRGMPRYAFALSSITFCAGVLLASAFFLLGGAGLNQDRVSGTIGAGTWMEKETVIIPFKHDELRGRISSKEKDRLVSLEIDASSSSAWQARCSFHPDQWELAGIEPSAGGTCELSLGPGSVVSNHRAADRILFSFRRKTGSASLDLVLASCGKILVENKLRFGDEG